MKISLLGPPGSGKGSYARRLNADYRIKVISLGDILRAEVEKKSEVGTRVRAYMNKGKLVPDNVVLEIVNKNVGKEDMIFDGFPRDMSQVNVNVDKIIYLACSDDLCIKRIVNRRICEKCNKIYNLITLKPKKKGICDVCCGKLISRNDQTEHVIKERLKVFRKETLPVINYYKEKGNLVEIDGERSADEVYNDIRKLFKSKE